MSYTISREDNYCLIAVQPGPFDKAEKDKMVIDAHKALRDLPWVILDMSKVVKLDDLELAAVKGIKASAIKFNGGMILACLNKELVKTMKSFDKEVICLPTVAESIDYVFMEQLEKDFDDDDDDLDY